MFDEVFNKIQLSSLKNSETFKELMENSVLNRSYKGYETLSVKKDEDGNFIFQNVDRFSKLTISINQDITLSQHLLSIYLNKIDDFDFFCHFLTEEEITKSHFLNEQICFGPVDDTTFLKSKLLVSNIDRKENIVSSLVVENNFLFFSNDEANFEQLYKYIFSLRKLTQKKRA